MLYSLAFIIKQMSCHLFLADEAIIPPVNTTFAIIYL